jgi:hypothetical protein
MAPVEIGTAALASSALLTSAHLIRYRMYLKAVERYAAGKHAHDEVIEYAKAIRPSGPVEVARRAVTNRSRKAA